MDLRRRRALLACALTVLASACSSGAAPAEVGAGSAPGAPPAGAAVAVVADPDVAAAEVVAPQAMPDPAGAPSFVGLDLDALADAAAGAGVAVQVVAFAADGDASSAPPLVTVQDPPAGTPLSRGRAVVVWLGTPPALPPRPAPAPALPPAAEEEVVVADAVPATATSAVEPETDADPTGGVAVDVAPTPAPDDRPPAPTRPRSDIRRMPAAEPGTSFAGRASWYGEELRGSPMACGGRFDPDAATIASRELRCGTRVRITAANGASTEAVVTDWGPAEWTGKRVDLSRAVFEHLAPASRGWLDVEVVVLGG